MKKSIFRKILFVILPIIIIAEIGTLSLAYFLIYDSNFNYCENNVRIASKMAAENFALFDPNNIEDSKNAIPFLQVFANPLIWRMYMR